MNRARSALHRINLHPALEYEFYLPNKIIKARAVREFIHGLEKYGKGALLFPGALGKWRQTSESLFIYRKIIIPASSSGSKIRRSIIGLLSAMNAALKPTKQQDAVVFSERKITWVVLKKRRARLEKS